MEHYSPSSEHDQDLSDNFDYTLKSSTRRTFNQTSYFSPTQRFPDSTPLTFQDIITDEQTLEFLYKHFSGMNPEHLDIESFLDVLLQEFFLRNPSLTSTIEDIELFRRELRELLRARLTTNDEEVVSLNALEVNTKKKGLYDFVFSIAMEAEGETKKKKNMQINEAIVEELSAVTQMLDSKKLELTAYERRLREYEQSLIEREERMRASIHSEYEKLMKSFDESCKDKFSALQKKFVTHEKNTRTKIKQYESQIKEMKSFTASISGNEEKLKYKLSSLERSNDFLKLKAQDLEKKLVQEQEAKQTTSQKNQKLLNKVSILEKSMKDMNATSLGASQTLQKHLETEHTHHKFDERPLEVIDLNASQTKEWYEKTETEPRGPSLSPDFDEKEQENIKPKKKKTTSTKTPATKKTTKPGTIEISPPNNKKKLAASSSSAAASVLKAATGPSAEFKVLLNVVHSLIVCLKSTLPIFMQNADNKEGLSERGSAQRKSAHQRESVNEKVPIDLGEVFYPCFDNLIANLTELLPIVGKQYDTKYVSSIVEVYYKLLSFFFKFKVQHRFDHIIAENRLLSEYEIQNSTDRIKTGQDHINEIMVASQTSKTTFELNFAPQTEYWKKIIKTTKPLQKSKFGADLQSSVMSSLAKNNKAVQNKQDKDNSYIHLFGEELIQKEVITIFKKYLDSTELMLRGNDDKINPSASVNSVIVKPNMTLETQKYMQITRLYTSLSTVLLAGNRKEQLLGLQSLVVDLNVDNPKIAEFLRVFLIENDGLNVLFWILQNFVDDFEVLQVATDILLSLNYNGAHYRSFIETISKEENIEVVFYVLSKYGENNEFCEKMSVIVQRITYHNSLQGKIPQKYIRFLREKLAELELSKKNQFFIANIRSILANLNAI